MYQHSGMPAVGVKTSIGHREEFVKRRDAAHLGLLYRMPMKNVVTPHTTALGLVSWLVPFVVSFLFVDRTGQFLIPQPLFKSLMVVVFGGFGTALLVVAFRRIVPSTRSGLALGCYWLLVNLVLDLLVLVPLIGMPVVTYLYDIGLRYLLIPIISTAIGRVGQSVRELATSPNRS